MASGAHLTDICLPGRPRHHHIVDVREHGELLRPLLAKSFLMTSYKRTNLGPSCRHASPARPSILLIIGSLAHSSSSNGNFPQLDLGAREALAYRLRVPSAITAIATADGFSRCEVRSRAAPSPLI